MPELPEVETVMRGLEPFLSGKILKDIQTHRADLRVPFPARLGDLKGRKIDRLTRRAKYLLIHFGDDILVIHLGMSGRMVVHPDVKDHSLEKHDHMVMVTKDGAGVVFNDPRRFGMALLIKEAELTTHKAFKKLGPEPLSKEFDGAFLRDALASKNTPIKSALLDQHLVVGIGNIYACEALFEAGIDPRKKSRDISNKKADELAQAIKDVLKRAIAAGGSSLKDYRQADGNLGYFQHSFKVYGRAGEPCPRCKKGGKKASTIHKITQAGRSTFYCPACQR
jgi:formamidopyrimidine-DNA glycosylase